MLTFVPELNSLILQLDERESAASSRGKAGRFRKKQRRLSTPSSQIPPEGAPLWTTTTCSPTENTPQGGTGVGAGARRTITEQL